MSPRNTPKSRAPRALDGSLGQRMTMTGFCAFPSKGAHGYCHENLIARGRSCACPCHTSEVPPSSAGFGDPLPPLVLAPAPPATPEPTSLKRRLPAPAGRPDAVPAGTPLLDLDYSEADLKLVQALSWPTVIVDVPPVFYADHVSRELPAGVELKRLLRHTRVQLDREAYDELLEDARFYVETGIGENGFDADLAGIVASARSTVKVLEAVARPEAPAGGTK